MFWLITVAVALLAVVNALPFGARDVYDPPITLPNEQTVWTVGQVTTVSWDTSGLPPDSQLTNPNGRVILGHLANNSLNLRFSEPLAEGFRLREGHVNITVPDVETRNDYIVVLMGSSGNSSPIFTIRRSTGASAAPGSFSSASSSASVPITTSLITTPIPITGTEITGGSDSATSAIPESTNASSIPVPVTTTPSSSGLATTANPSSSPPTSASASASLPSSSAVQPASSGSSGSNEDSTDGAWGSRPSVLAVFVTVVAFLPFVIL